MYTATLFHQRPYISVMRVLETRPKVSSYYLYMRPLIYSKMAIEIPKFIYVIVIKREGLLVKCGRKSHVIKDFTWLAYSTGVANLNAVYSVFLDPH